MTDLASVHSIIMSASLRCTPEVLTAQPGGGRRTEVFEEAIARDDPRPESLPDRPPDP